MSSMFLCFLRCLYFRTQYTYKTEAFHSNSLKECICFHTCCTTFLLLYRFRCILSKLPNAGCSFHFHYMMDKSTCLCHRPSEYQEMNIRLKSNMANWLNPHSFLPLFSPGYPTDWVKSQMCNSLAKQRQWANYYSPQMRHRLSQKHFLESKLLLMLCSQKKQPLLV